MVKLSKSTVGLLTLLVPAFAISVTYADENPWQLNAGTEIEDADGTLNPDEMTLNKAIKNAMRGKVDMMTCAQGYMMTKMGNHGDARTIFKNCAAKGYTGTMTWMSYMETNGAGGEPNPEKAAEWDLKAAQSGDPIGQFNYGLNLLRGHGVEQNMAEGKKFIDKAAKAGLPDAVEVQRSGYDWNVVTPDADNWRYEKRVF